MQWILESRDLQLPIQSKTIQRKVMALIQPTNPEFRESDGWLQKFMTRNSLSLRRHTSTQQKLPGDLEKKLEEFISSIQTLRKCHHFPNSFIINMGETPIFLTCKEHGQCIRKVLGRFELEELGKKCVTFVNTCTSDAKAFGYRKGENLEVPQQYKIQQTGCLHRTPSKCMDE